MNHRWSRINMVLKVNSGIGKMAGLQAFSPELIFAVLISLTTINQFQFKGSLLFNVTENNSFLLRPRYLPKVGCMKISQLKSSVKKLFQSNKLSSHFHTINACGACIITVVRRSSHNSMLHERLKRNNKTQSKFMTSTNTKLSLSITI